MVGRALATAMTALAVGAFGLVACSSDDGGGTSDGSDATAAVAVDATVEGPVTGGNEDSPPNQVPGNILEKAGYVEDEYFVSGDATSYRSVGELTSDGFWTVREVDPAPFTTRVMVRHPENPDDFNGTVIVEWFNVTGGVDFDPDFGMGYPAVLDEGYAYVAVSAQKVSVDGAGAPALELPGAPPEELLRPLTERDPERYGDLSHPGDDYSYDIVTQAGQLARNGEFTDGAPVDNVILVGESQSAGRIATYVNAVQPVAEAYDGFLVHSRSASSAPLVGDAVPPPVVLIRTDLEVPVFQFETETDVARGFLSARQPNTDRIMTWEVAGAAHADDSLTDYGVRSTKTGYDLETLCGAVNTGPQQEVLRAAISALGEWVVDGTAPPATPRIETSGDEMVRDELGIVVGGARTPPVDAPKELLTGVNDNSSTVCSLFGSTIPFTAEQLAALYPTHTDYVDAVTEAADAAVDAGVLRQAEGDAYITEAEAARVPE